MDDAQWVDYMILLIFSWLGGKPPMAYEGQTGNLIKLPDFPNPMIQDLGNLDILWYTNPIFYANLRKS